MRKVLVNFDRNGFSYMLDRATGELLMAEPFVDRELGDRRRPEDRQADRESREADVGDEEHEGHLSVGDGRQEPAAGRVLADEPDLFYVPTNNLCMDYEGVRGEVPGGPAVRRRDRGEPCRARAATAASSSRGIRRRARRCGASRKSCRRWGGALATGGDVVFYGTMEGWLKAVNAKTGEVLWKFKTPSGIIGNPMTYVGPDGKQYVAVLSGIGGWSGIGVAADMALEDPTAGLGAIGAFGDVGELQQPGRRVDGVRASVTIVIEDRVLLCGPGCPVWSCRSMLVLSRVLVAGMRSPTSRRRARSSSASAPIRRTCRFRTRSWKDSKTRSPTLHREGTRRDPQLHLVGTAPRLHPKHDERDAEGRALRHRDRRPEGYDLVARPSRTTDRRMSSCIRKDKGLADQVAGRSDSQEAQDRRASARRRLHESAAGSRAREARHRRQRRRASTRSTRRRIRRARSSTPSPAARSTSRSSGDRLPDISSRIRRCRWRWSRSLPAKAICRSRSTSRWASSRRRRVERPAWRRCSTESGSRSRRS